MDLGFFKILAEIFKEYPGYISLLIIIYFLFRALAGKDSTIKDLLQISTKDTERTMKLTTLIELLLSEKLYGKGKNP